MGKATNQGDVFSKSTSSCLFHGQAGKLVGLLPFQCNLVVLDSDFKHAFSNKVLKTTQSRNKRVARYILDKLEQHLRGNEHDIGSDRFNLEHIMPENLSDIWNQISDLDHELFVYRLGNLCLLHTGQNRYIGNLGFDEKRNSYQNSEFHQVRRLAEEYSFWDTSRIDQTQQWMSNQATSIWRISQFDR